MEELDGYIASLHVTPNDYITIRKCLKHLRNSKLRRSDLVARFGHKLLVENPAILTQVEMWEVFEQVFLAALDIHNTQLATDCLYKIRMQFGDESIRVMRLVGMQKEAQGKWKEADQIYKHILELEPSNSLVMKRQICIRKAMGDILGATKLLNEYLKIFMGDVDAWLELADLYLDQQLFKNAAFCYEEVVLSIPKNPHMFSKYAEVLYTLGGFDNYKLARKYFAFAVEIEPDNVRALYGVCMAAIACHSTKQGKQDSDKQINLDLFHFAYDKLTEIYKAKAPEKLKLLEALVSKTKE